MVKSLKINQVSKPIINNNNVVFVILIDKRVVNYKDLILKNIEKMLLIKKEQKN